MNNNCGIYRITSPSGRIYVGQAKNIKARWRDYYGLYSSVIGQTMLYRSLKKYGVEEHAFEVIENCTEQDLNTRERYWQDLHDVLNGGLNCVLQESGEKRRVFSEETRKKMSEAQIGSKSHLYGKKLTQETRKKMSERQIGDKNHMFGVYGILHHNYNKVVSNESKSKMSQAQNRVNSKLKVGFASKPLIDIETGVFYYSIKDASNIYTISYSHLNKMLNGDRTNKTNLRRC